MEPVASLRELLAWGCWDEGSNGLEWMRCQQLGKVLGAESFSCPFKFLQGGGCSL